MAGPELTLHSAGIARRRTSNLGSGKGPYGGHAEARSGPQTAVGIGHVRVLTEAVPLADVERADRTRAGRPRHVDPVAPSWGAVGLSRAGDTEHR